MKITMYRAKATRTIPVTVDFICEFCDHPNTDDSQVLVADGYSHGNSVKIITERMKTDAAKNLEIQTEESSTYLKPNSSRSSA